MDKIHLKLLKEHFYKLSNDDQWVWVVETELKDKFYLYIDNDMTSVHWIDDDESEYEMIFKSDIGDRKGVMYLLDAIGIEARCV